jgi:hypothetical protein
MTYHRPHLKDKGKRIKDETGKQFICNDPDLTREFLKARMKVEL